MPERMEKVLRRACQTQDFQSVKRQPSFKIKKAGKTFKKVFPVFVFKRESGVIYAGGSVTAVAGPVGMEEFAAFMVKAFVCVCAEIVALRLEQVCGKKFRTVSVKI